MQGSTRKNQPGFPYDDNKTLDYIWRNSASELTNIYRWRPPQEVAVYCFSVLANHFAGLEELPPPLGLPVAPFYIKWSHRKYPIIGVQMFKRPCAIAELLKSATLQGWKHLEVAMNTFISRQRNPTQYLRCIPKSQSADIELNYEHCTIEFGVLFAFRQLPIAADFSAEAEFIFAEVKADSEHWYCAYSSPTVSTVAQVNFDKARHILNIFNRAGYKDVDKKIDEFWRNLRITVAEVATCSANLADYHMSVVEMGNLNTSL